MEYFLTALSDSPIVGFTVLLLVTLVLPPIFERLRLPGLVGLLVAGVFLGSYGLGILDANSEMMQLFSDIGKIYLLFVAGLEIDLAEFRKTKDHSLGFGTATFLFPLIFGIVVGQLFGMGLNASVLVGSLLASHTLLGYPIVNRLGVVNNQAVTVTIGATIFTDIAALLVLAICVSIHAGEFSAVSLVMQLGTLAVYAAIVLFGFDKAGKEYFQRTGDEQSNQFLFILLVVFLASVGAQLINIDKIVGAFLAGLAVNDVVGHSPVEEKIEFVGSTLFIPFFFVHMGLLLDIPGFVTSLTTEFLLTAGIVIALISSKFLAALVVKLIYGYNWDECLTMWSLSLPQVAATLAAALVGLNAGVISSSVFNAVIVLMLVTAILGPILTDHFARRLPLLRKEVNAWESAPIVKAPLAQSFALFANENYPLNIVVPVANPHTERYLVEMAVLLARHGGGVVMPLSITKAHVHMDEPEMSNALRQNRRLLQRAVVVGQEFNVPVDPINRIDDDVAHGISRAAREVDASLVIMGWSTKTGLQARLFGTLIDSVFWSTHCPVAVMRLLDEPLNMQRILVPVKNLTTQSLLAVRFAQLFAETNQAEVTLLWVCDRKTSKDKMYQVESELNHFVSQAQAQSESRFHVQILQDDDVAQAILQTALEFDLVVLRSMRRRTAGGLAVSDVATQLLAELRGSLVLFGEPHGV
jgi:Kef-type K+ transport system membrane component KefB/nucleotide-binding universal stress UspA family protein